VTSLVLRTHSVSTVFRPPVCFHNSPSVKQHCELGSCEDEWFMYYYALPLLIVLTVLIVLFCVNCIIIINCTNCIISWGRGQAPSPDPTPSCTTILHTSRELREMGKFNKQTWLNLKHWCFIFHHIIRDELPLDITSAPSLPVFRQRLKTFLFRRSCPDLLI